MQSYINLWNIAVLALLREAPMHPYQMQRLLKQRHKDELLVLKRGSLYHAINRLLDAGLIAAGKVERDGKRPERTTYRITPEGRAALKRMLEQMIAVPRRESSEFMAALSFLPHLEPAGAIAKLTERAQRLEEETGSHSADLKAAAQHVPRLHLIESEYLIAMQRAELKWVRQLLSELTSRELDWNKGIFLEAAAERRAAASKRKRSK